MTFNSVEIIRETVTQALKVSHNIFVVDSGSTDGTIEILYELGCHVAKREFLGYSSQRNWAINQVKEFSWQLHLDADEVLDELGISQINLALQEMSPHNAYMIKRRDYFMGKMLRFSGLNPWHLRLFKTGFVCCENRLYDQHFVSDGSVGRLKGFMHDKNCLTLTEWVRRHNHWSTLEAQEILNECADRPGILRARFWGDARERTRFFKKIYYKLPNTLRSFLYFFYRYFIALGFLDGATGFYFIFFQALWFRMLVDAKYREILDLKN
nr:glycosyltransferase family 2 protein [Polynucleobacter sp. P1-05-14]